MKILFLIDSLGPCGKERQLVELLKGLDIIYNFKTKVVLFTNFIHYKDVHNLNCEISIIERKRKRDFSIFYKLYKIFNQFKPDIIHSWERMCTFYGLPASKFIEAKFIDGSIQNATPHPKKYCKRWLQEKLTFPLSNVIVSNTAAGLKAYKVNPKKGFYVHNGYDLSRLDNLVSSETIRNKFNISTPKVVGMVGRFDLRKDYQTFIKCAIKILKNREDVTFLSIGDGTNARGDISRSTFELCKKMVPSEFQNKIIFTGLQTNVESIINILSIGVLLTNFNVHGEGVSNSIMEYSALGKPVIATLSGGTPEIIREGVNGFLIPKNDIELLEEKLNLLLDDNRLAISMGEEGKHILHNEFNLEVMTQNFVNLYKQILQNK
jgi:glycosyltransferase involved in cell wall biosynthesis